MTHGPLMCLKGKDCVTALAGSQTMKALNGNCRTPFLSSTWDLVHTHIPHKARARHATPNWVGCDPCDHSDHGHWPQIRRCTALPCIYCMRAWEKVPNALPPLEVSSVTRQQQLGAPLSTQEGRMGEREGGGGGDLGVASMCQAHLASRSGRP